MADKLMEHLFSAWTDCAPAQISMSAEPLAMQCMTSILRCMSALIDGAPPDTVIRYCGRICMCVSHVNQSLSWTMVINKSYAAESMLKQCAADLLVQLQHRK